MTSESKVRANSANSQASTGPKTARGRARSARNAVRHALNVPIDANPALSEEIEELAQQIAGPDVSVEIQCLARQIAEAQIDVRRAREARLQLFSDPIYDSEANTRQKITLLGSILSDEDAHAFTLDELADFLALRPQGPEKLASIVSDKIGRLRTLDRYERRALSRRKLAIRALDLARR